MIKLLELDENYEVQLNKAWLGIIPAFSTIIKKDKGSTGDYRGDKKLMARKKFGFISLMLDFDSPLRELDEIDRRGRAMEYTGLEEKDLNDPDLAEAMAHYEKILLENARPLKTLKAVKRGLTAMDNYFENINFDQKDKQGKLLFSPKEYVANISEVKKAYESLNQLEDSITEMLTNNDTVRGDVDLGDMEENRDRFTELLTQSESRARTKAIEQMAEDDEGFDIDTYEPPDDESYQVVPRKPAKKITGPSLFELGRLVTELNIKKEEDDGLSQTS